MPDRARRPAHWAPADLNGHVELPRLGCYQVTLGTPRARFAGSAAALIRTGNRRIGDALTTGGHGPRPSGSRGASAIGAGFRGSASSGIKSPPFLGSLSIGAERVERSPPVLQTGMLPLHHAPEIFRAAEHGERSLSIRWEARHGPFRFLRGDASHSTTTHMAGPILAGRRASPSRRIRQA